MKVTLVPTGIANLASVSRGLERLGADVSLAASVRDIRNAGRLVLPGVGAFGAAVDALGDLDEGDRDGGDAPGPPGGSLDAVRAHVRAGKPLLAVCLGFQLMGAASEESPGRAGLALHPGVVRRFGSEGRCPHLGWNQVQAPDGCRYLQTGHYYFAHSFRLPALDEEGWTSALCSHTGPFVAGLERGPVLACQFHPELSGRLGARVLDAWLQEAPRC